MRGLRHAVSCSCPLKIEGSHSGYPSLAVLAVPVVDELLLLLLWPRAWRFVGFLDAGLALSPGKSPLWLCWGREGGIT